MANRPVSKGELIIPEGEAFHLDVSDTEAVQVTLQETGETHIVHVARSAVPNNTDCEQSVLEIPWCFMNHSCVPNTRDRWDPDSPFDLKLAETEAGSDIAAGEELTFDYALEQYEYAGNVKCWCGSKRCRGTVTGFKDLDEHHKALLHPQASPYVQDRYRRDMAMKTGTLSTLGRHIVVDYWNCDLTMLNDQNGLEQILCDAALAAGATVMSVHSHGFDPHGVTAVAILGESHLSLHTWPEYQYAAMDIFTCGNCDPMLAHAVIEKALEAKSHDLKEMQRGDKTSQPTKKEENPSALPDKWQNPNNWFWEGTVPGRRYGNVYHGFNITEALVNEKTRFQDCQIFENPVYGKVLVLDNIVQLSTFDEHIYHEMLVHQAMFAHTNPKQVVIVGGGDGGTLREVLKHNPQEVVMIDIDEQFVNLAAEHLPTLSDGAFDDPRVTLIYEDASVALKRWENRFDVAIIDCNDAIGPSTILFEEDFYRTVANSLTKDGMCAVQVGSMLDVDFLYKTRERIEASFCDTSPIRLTIPCYHCGEYIFYVASKTHPLVQTDVSSLTALQNERRVITKHWSPQMQLASQVQPPSMM